jgi:hypothetical protein
MFQSIISFIGTHLNLLIVLFFLLFVFWKLISFFQNNEMEEIFDIRKMNEEEKKMYFLTQLNTKLNRNLDDKIELIADKSK